METNHSTFDHEAGLKVIYAMIESAKSKIGKNYFYYLFWGYLVAFTCLADYILITFDISAVHYLVWPVLMTLGCLVTFCFHWKQKKQSANRTFIGTAMWYLWLGWLVSFVILIVLFNARSYYREIIPMTLALYGLAIFVSGGLVNYRPLVTGALVSWGAAIGTFFVSYPIQLLIMTGVVIIAYIIPGHLLKNLSKKS